MDVAERVARAAPWRSEALARVREWLGLNWPITCVLVAFAGSAFIVPTLAPVATTDDWGYTRSVEILVREGRLTVFPVVAATAVFQIGWGALFALLFGMTLGVMRVATVVMVALGGVGLYALLRELGVQRGRSALGVAAYLFSPLAFVLAYTFMTDSYLTSLLIIATYCYVRGLRPEQVSSSMIVAGSVVAACAFLTRQQGALIPLAVVTYLLLSRRLRPNRAGLGLFLQIVAIPVGATVAYYVWLKYFNDVPNVQTGFLDEARNAGVSGGWRLTRHLLFIALMYLGFFCLPIVIALIPGLRRLVRGMPTGGWILFLGWEPLLILGLATSYLAGRWMPYVPQFVGAGGLGPPDVLGSRPRMFDGRFFDWATFVCAASAFLFALVLCRGFAASLRSHPGAALLLTITLWQVIGIIPPSFHYLRRGYSLDRYLLPLLPLGLCLVLWAARDLRLAQPAAWFVVAVFALFAVAGTRDYLVFMHAVWDMASAANAAGVRNERLDAGAAWDGYHLYTYGLETGITRARTRPGPWWTYFYGKATNSSYVVAGRPRTRYATVWVRPYSSWLQRRPTKVYLLRRYGIPAPP
ncbi:MAG: glycosyltransferase family 39 protein [Thermomicrobiales bacterium]